MSVISSGNLNTDLAGIGSTETTLFISGTTTFSGSGVTVPANVHLELIDAGRLSVGANQTLTIAGTFTCGQRQAFVYGSLTTSVVQFTRKTVLLPQWWGAKGDGATDDALALQRFLDVMSVSRCAHGHLPQGTYNTSVGLKLHGMGDNIDGIRLTGDIGGTQGAAGSVIKYVGAILDSDAVLKTVGITGSVISHIEINCNNLAARGLWISIENPSVPVDVSSQSVQVDHVCVGVMRDVLNSCGFGVGPEEGTVVGGSSDVAHISFHKCQVLDNGAGGRRTYTSAWRAYQGNNTKDFAIHDCIFHDCAVGIDCHPQLSGSMTVVNPYFGRCGVDILKGGSGSLHVIGANSELSGKALTDNGSNPSSATLTQWFWNGATTDAEGVVISTQGQLTIDGCSFTNRNVEGVLSLVPPPTSFDDAVDRLHIVGNATDGTRARLFKIGGSGTFPPQIGEGVDYYTFGGGTSFQLKRNGAVVPFSSGGVPDPLLRIVSPVRIQIDDPVIGKSSLVVTNSFFQGMHDVLDVTGVGGTQSLIDPFFTVASPRILAFGNFGGVFNGIRPLRNRGGSGGRLAEHQDLSVPLTPSNSGFQVISMGSPGQPDTYAVDFAWLKREFPGLSSTSLRLVLPAGQGVEWAVLDVESAFAGSGLSTAKIWLSDLSSGQGSLLGVNAGTGISCLTAGKKGRTLAELGTAFTSNMVLGAHYFTSDAEALFQTNVPFGSLTAGRAYLRVKRRVMV